MFFLFFFFFKQKTAYEMRISDWSSDVCSSDLLDDIAACRQGLPKGQPCLRRPAAFDDLAPQNEDIDAAVAASGRRVARKTGRGAAIVAVAASPRLHPREAARLQFAYDAARHLVVQVGAVGGGLGSAAPAVGAPAAIGSAHV